MSCIWEFNIENWVVDIDPEMAGWGLVLVLVLVQLASGLEVNNMPAIGSHFGVDGSHRLLLLLLLLNRSGRE